MVLSFEVVEGTNGIVDADDVVLQQLLVTMVLYHFWSGGQLRKVIFTFQFIIHL